MKKFQRMKQQATEALGRLVMGGRGGGGGGLV